MLDRLLGSIFGTKNERELKRLWRRVEDVNDVFEQLKGITAQDLAGRTEALTDRVREGEALTPEIIRSLKRSELISLPLADPEQDVFPCFPVAPGKEQILRIRRDIEGAFRKTKKLQVHFDSVQSGLGRIDADVGIGLGARDHGIDLKLVSHGSSRSREAPALDAHAVVVSSRGLPPGPGHDECPVGIDGNIMKSLKAGGCLDREGGEDGITDGIVNVTEEVFLDAGPVGYDEGAAIGNTYNHVRRRVVGRIDEVTDAISKSTETLNPKARPDVSVEPCGHEGPVRRHVNGHTTVIYITRKRIDLEGHVQRRRIGRETTAPVEIVKTWFSSCTCAL